MFDQDKARAVKFSQMLPVAQENRNQNQLSEGETICCGGGCCGGGGCGGGCCGGCC